MTRAIRFLGGASVAGRTFGRGDVWAAPESDVRPLVDCGTAEWAEGGEGPDVDRTTWNWSVSDARQHVAAMDDAATLRRWHTGETRHPKYTPNGRKGVLDAIEERMGELKITDSAEGLARGPEA